VIRIVLRALWIFSASAIRAPEPTLVIFKEICAIEENDGILFDVEALRVELIREKLACGGLGLRTIIAWLAGARITVVIDIGFGDAVEPGVEKINLPVLLDLSVPRLRVPSERDSGVRLRHQPHLERVGPSRGDRDHKESRERGHHGVEPNTRHPV